MLKNANKKEDIVLLVEQQRTLSKNTLHREKQFFLISSARHFKEDLKKKGFKTEYLISESFAEAFETIRKKYPQHVLCAASPNSFGAQEQMLKNQVNLLPNDFFLTSKDEFQANHKLELFHLVIFFYFVSGFFQSLAESHNIF